MGSRLEIELKADQILRAALTNLQRIKKTGNELGNRKETAEIISNTRGSNDGEVYHASVGTNVEKYLFEELKCHVDNLFGKDCAYSFLSSLGEQAHTSDHSVENSASLDSSDDNRTTSTLHSATTKGLVLRKSRIKKMLPSKGVNTTDSNDDGTSALLAAQICQKHVKYMLDHGAHIFQNSQSLIDWANIKFSPSSQLKKRRSQTLRINRKLKPTKMAKLYNTRRSVQIISAEIFWEVTRPFIFNVHNVASDGHCGFRAVAAGLEMDSSHGWLFVRKELIKELTSFKKEYMKVFGDEGDIKLILNVLGCTESPCPPESWFALPAMGHLVASAYQVVFVCISEGGAQTFVPLRSLPSTNDPKVIAIGHVNRVHFVSIKLIPGCPIPRPINVRTDRKVAEKWVDLLKNRNDKFDAISGCQRSTQGEAEDNTIVIN